MDKVDLKAEAGASVPNISIIMPTYNSEAFVGETIESVIAQTYPSWSSWWSMTARPMGHAAS